MGNSESSNGGRRGTTSVDVVSDLRELERENTTLRAELDELRASQTLVAARAEEAVRESERFLGDVFASIQDGISVLGLDRTVLRVNPTLERWYTHSLPMVGKKCFEVYHQASAPCSFCPCTITIETGAAARAVVPFTHPNQEPGWQELFSFPLVDTKTGQLKGVIEYVRDITAQHLAELELARRNQELLSANEELRKLQRAREQSMAMVSHELRSPLVTGLGYVEMLLDGVFGPVPEKMADRMRTAQRNLTRLRTLIEAMLSYRRLLEYDTPVIAPVALRPLLQEIWSEFLVRAGLGGDELRLEIAAGVKGVMADASLIRRAIDNLLDNATVHAGADGIRLVARPVPQGRIELAVIDRGPGFAPEIRERAFLPFVRSSESPTGTGLGLAIVQAIVQAHGSEVFLQTETGRTCISFQLPAADLP